MGAGLSCVCEEPEGLKWIEAPYAAPNYSSDQYFAIDLGDQYHLIDPRKLQPTQSLPITFLGFLLTETGIVRPQAQ